MMIIIVSVDRKGAMSLHVGFGALTLQRGPDDPRSWSDIWHDGLAIAVAAEDAGFESVWVGEHHFSEDGYLPAVFPMLAALAVTTERAWIGTKVALAPLYHPLRLAEDAAAVQLLSRGRLILGLAIGYRDEELQAFGTNRRQRVARLEECIEVCRQAWSGRPVYHRGPLTHIKGESVEPAPGHIPIWLGGRAGGALARAGALGDGFVAPVGPPDDLVDQLNQIDEAAAAAGRPPPPVSSSAFVILHGSTAPEGAHSGLNALLATYGRWKADDKTSRVGQSTTAPGLVIEGDAERVAARLRLLVEAVDPDREHHLVVRLEYPGMSRQAVTSHLQQFAEQVIPLLPSVGRSGARP
jgi:alkanesulfonate monooxygenase SsuD/methylene tetrahydromethanopterin reductase-like flavin-dependent oxidoreductase (luciferase family)